MAFEPQPFVAVYSGDAQDAPEGAKPVSIYGVEAGGEAAPHTHAAKDITSGTLDVARIPSLSITKITALQAKITELEGRLGALEAAAV